MTPNGQRELLTQQRVIALFLNEFGYRYFGNRSNRDNRP